MPYDLFKTIHVILAILLAVYGLLVFWLDARNRKLDPASDAFAAANKRFMGIHRLANYAALIAFLLGGAIGAKFFKAGHLWIYGKLLLFIVLLGVMGALGNRALKMRGEAAASGQREALLQAAARKMNLYKIIQLVVLALLFYLAFEKPF